ncbi:hypothetical protein B296_00002727 [Ensete ventricosum]|uniref:Uncharacterized protein n=1 Tax=Ensete ventricosum TaxID=4639 RepID=A0A427AUF5_ENSVE|nr:hypothetical protein B296_00002727 [Ensete ventricosum]
MPRARRNSLCCPLFPKPMAILRAHRGKHRPRALVVPLLAVSAAAALAVIWFLFFPPVLTSAFSLAPPAAAYASESEGSSGLERKYLYWGSRIDCPGKHCDSCAGLGHQESSLRCALEEALFLQRSNLFRFFVALYFNERIAFSCKLLWEKVIGDCIRQYKFYTCQSVWIPCRVFVMPSRMCINPLHNKKGILHQHSNTSSEERCETELIIQDATMKKKKMHNPSRFMECKDRTNRSSVLLPYAFLPMVAARKLRDAADKVLMLQIL